MKPADAAPATPCVRSLPVTVHRAGATSSAPDWVAEEVPVALVCNGIAHAVMLASPADLEDFALGFGLTEGLLDHAGELRAVDVVPAGSGLELRMEVAAACEWRLRQRRRALAGRTGCGLCGVESLAQVRRTLPTVPPVRLALAALARAQRELHLLQEVQRLAGATHAAAWCDLQGAVRIVREDVGRHNALDKLVGAMVRAGVDAGAGFVCVTSRASFEMVQKTALAGAGALAAVSAPTALAVECAQACGMALAGRVRGDDFVAYTHPERFGLAAG